MSSPQTRSLDLPAEQIDRIEALVQSGKYPSSGELIREALLALEEKMETLDEWLLEDVAPVYDELEAHPERALTAEQVTNNLRAHYEKHIRKTA